MTNNKKAVLGTIPFLLIGLVLLLWPKVLEWKDARIVGRLETEPLKSKITTSGNTIRSSRHTYSIGDYGVTDIGMARIAIRNLPYSGSSSSSILIETDSTHSGKVGSTGVGIRKFETHSMPGGSECTFGGVKFQFTESKLRIGDAIVDATGVPTLVIVGDDGVVESIRPMSVPAP